MTQSSKSTPRALANYARRIDAVVRLALVLLILTLVGCSSAQPRVETSAAVLPAQDQVNVFDRFMNSGVPPADGFDLPVGSADHDSTSQRNSGWNLSSRFGQNYEHGINPGQDWSRSGHPAEHPQEIYAVANGRVLLAENEGPSLGNVIIIEHAFYENQGKRTILSFYSQLREMEVRPGEEVRKRQPIATSGGRLHFELRWDEKLSPTFRPSSEGKELGWITEHYADPGDFIEANRTLFVPQQEPTLVLVDQTSYKTRIYRRGQLRGEYDVSLGQGKGQKRAQGDNKTPRGMYFVIQKHRGEFEGPYGGYYGGHWIKINYPNKYDALNGRFDGVISARQASQISRSWERREPTLEGTGLGGGIGFHGWIKEWDNGGSRHLSWGCVVMHLSDIRALYDEIPEGTMVIIF